MRRALNVLQACHASSTPLQPVGTSKADLKNVKRDMITETTIYDCVAAPHPDDIKLIRNTILETKDVVSCLQTVNSLKATKGLALADILTALSEELFKLEVPPQTRITWMEGLAEIEYRLSGGGNETVQTGAAVGAVRNGVELYEKK